MPTYIEFLHLLASFGAHNDETPNIGVYKVGIKVIIFLCL